MIIDHSITSPVRSTGAVRRDTSASGALPAVAPNSQPGQQWIPLVTRDAAPEEVTARVPAPDAWNERIDLRVLNATPVSRPGQRAIDAYQATAQLSDDGSAVVFGLDETA